MGNSFNQDNLGLLADPTAFHEPINLSDFTEEKLQQFLKTMIMIRKVEQQLALGRKDGLIRGPVHLGAGQEAVAVGVSESLQSTDRIFGTHRSHSHLI